jgi:hypothetical protein
MQVGSVPVSGQIGSERADYRRRMNVGLAPRRGPAVDMGRPPRCRRDLKFSLLKCPMEFREFTVHGELRRNPPYWSTHQKVNLKPTVGSNVDLERKPNANPPLTWE